MALDAQILLSILAHESSSEDISRTLRATPASYSLSLGNGTGANQAQVVWSDSGTASTPGTSFSTISLPDTLGGVSATVQIAAIKCFYVRNKSAGSLTLAFTAWEPLPSSVAIRGGGVFILVAPDAAGYQPTGLGQAFSLTAATSVDYEVVIIGEGSRT